MNTAAQIAEEVKKLGGKRVHTVPDKGVADAGLLEKVVEPLKTEKFIVQVFDQVEPEPAIENLLEAHRMPKSAGVDVFVGPGGGSAMDVTKVASALMTPQEADVSDLFGVEKVTKPGLPTIIVPTTSGTGSEVTRMAIFTDKEENLTSPWQYAKAVDSGGYQYNL